MQNTSCCMLYRLIFSVGLEDVSMPFNKTRDPHVTSCDPGHKDFNLKLIYSSNRKDNRVEHVGANLASRAVYSICWWDIVRNILKIHPLYFSYLIAYFPSSDSTANHYISNKYHPTEKYCNSANHTHFCCS